jgi:hydroxypyruvate reductase
MPEGHERRSLRRHAVQIFQAGLKAADPVEAVLRHVSVSGNALTAGKRRYELSRIRRVFVIGAGKASASMAVALERLLGSRIAGGAINVKYGHTAKLRRVSLKECGHPVPDLAGLCGAEAIAEIAREATAADLLICAISGGASALLPAPAPPVTLAEKQEMTRLLLSCGATIHEINTVRKHISWLKGGQLARMAAPARVISLILSDVIGDDVDAIGSGPTAPDPSTFDDALAILDRHGLRRHAPAPVRTRLEAGARGGDIDETPKSVPNAYNLVIGSNRLAMDAAVEKAKELGFRTMVLSTTVEGEAREVAHVHAAIAKEIVSSSRPVAAPACVLSGGETTVTVRGNGLGGRNQEFALAAALDIEGMSEVAILSAGTDGTDGPTDAAGAIADGGTLARARKAGVDARRFLENNDSYRFFAALGDLIHTGPTKTNVMDIRVVLVGRPA